MWFSGVRTCVGARSLQLSVHSDCNATHGRLAEAYAHVLHGQRKKCKQEHDCMYPSQQVVPLLSCAGAHACSGTPRPHNRAAKPHSLQKTATAPLCNPSTTATGGQAKFGFSPTTRTTCCCRRDNLLTQHRLSSGVRSYRESLLCYTLGWCRREG